MRLYRLLILVLAMGFPGIGVASVKNGETFDYIRKSTRPDSQGVRFKMLFSVEQEGGQTQFVYENRHPDGRWLVRTRADGTPVETNLARGRDNYKLKFSPDGHLVMNGVWEGKEREYKARFDPNATLENLMLLRTLPLEPGSKYSFQQFRPDKLPKLVPFRMMYQVLGKKTITVKAGTFRCKEVLFTCKSSFYRRFYKSYFYVSDDDHRYFVKEVNPSRGFVVDLQSIGYEPGGIERTASTTGQKATSTKGPS